MSGSSMEMQIDFDDCLHPSVIEIVSWNILIRSKTSGGGNIHNAYIADLAVTMQGKA